MFNWKKLGKIFDPLEQKDKNWMEIYAQSPNAIVFDNYIRVYFSSRAKADTNGQFISRLGYIDLDKNNLFNVLKVCENPILPLGERGTFDEFGTYPVSVIKDDKKINAYYAGWTRCESVPFNAAIGLATSFDGGNTFKKVGQGPILSYTPNEPFVLGSPRIKKFNGTYYLWYSAGIQWVKTEDTPQPVYKIRLATSTDGLNWIKEEKNLIESVLEENECQASAEVIYYKEKYHMFFSYRYNLGYREENRGYRIGYAHSKDLKNWFRDDSKAGIDKSDNGWDNESVSYPSIFELDNKLYMFYQGNGIGQNGFGIARLENYKE
ncbi:MAG TPA: hypothetical protein VJZ04_00410 [Lachnospiraceae bacterium]|nr:hypothetical protein [Lachnospiraceae bacterium]